MEDPLHYIQHLAACHRHTPSHSRPLKAWRNHSHLMMLACLLLLLSYSLVGAANSTAGNNTQGLGAQQGSGQDGARQHEFIVGHEHGKMEKNHSHNGHDHDHHAEDHHHDQSTDDHNHELHDHNHADGEEHDHDHSTHNVNHDSHDHASLDGHDHNLLDDLSSTAKKPLPKKEEAQIFIRELFDKYGHHGVMTYEGFEHLLESIGMAKIKIDDHDIHDHHTEQGFKVRTESCFFAYLFF